MATSDNPNPIPESESRMEEDEEQRNWAEINGDVLMTIFRMLGTLEVLKSAGSVCRAWRRVAKDEPDLWRRIDITNHGYGPAATVLTDPTKLAIDRSRGRLEEFSIDYLGDANLLQYLCDRTSVLKSLRMISCYQIFDEAVLDTVKRQPLLEELEITDGSCSGKLPELIGKELPNLKRFRFNVMWYYLPPVNEDADTVDNEEAFGIAKTMHELRHLQIVGNRLRIEGLMAILEGCPHLETLDVRRCFHLNMDTDMRARCARLTTLRLPGDPLDDYEFQAEASIDPSDLDAMFYDEFGVFIDEYGDDDFENIPFNFDGVDDDDGPINYDDFAWDMYDPTDSDDDGDGGNAAAALEEFL